MKFGLREVTFLILLVAIPLGSWWFVFHPREVQVSEAKRQMQAKRVKLQALHRASTAMSDLEKDIEQYNQAIEYFHSKLPSEKDIDKVVREVWKLAEASNLKIKTIGTLKSRNTVSIANPNGPFAEQPIELELEGDFNQGLYSFLLALERTSRITRIHELDVEKLKNGDEGQVNARLVLSIFFERGQS